MQNRKRDTDVQNRLLDSVGECKCGMFRENSIETCILLRVKQITSPDWMHETSAQGWCTGKTQRDWVEREVGGWIGMGNTCESIADSCQCMAKTNHYLITMMATTDSDNNQWSLKPWGEILLGIRISRESQSISPKIHWLQKEIVPTVWRNLEDTVSKSLSSVMRLIDIRCCLLMWYAKKGLKLPTECSHPKYLDEIWQWRNMQIQIP